MLDFQVPRISAESADETRGSFTIEPLDRGFGYTFGNSLRRVLLSSLAGAAVTSVRIEGVAHEFSTINGVKEDEMPFIFKRRRGRRRGLWWLSVMAGMVLFVLGLVLCGSELKDTEGPQQRLKPVIRDSWLGWTKMRYIFVLYVLRSERDS